MYTLFVIPRDTHERVLRSNPDLITRLFNQYEHEWNLNSVCIHNISDADFDELKKSIETAVRENPE